MTFWLLLFLIFWIPAAAVLAPIVGKAIKWSTR